MRVDQARRKVFLKLVYVLMSRLGKKNSLNFCLWEAFFKTIFILMYSDLLIFPLLSLITLHLFFVFFPFPPFFSFVSFFALFILYPLCPFLFLWSPSNSGLNVYPCKNIIPYGSTWHSYHGIGILKHPWSYPKIVTLHCVIWLPDTFIWNNIFSEPITKSQWATKKL